MPRFNRLALLALAGLSAPLPALAHEGDVGIRLNGSQLETYLVSKDERPLRGAPVERVFGSELGSIEFGPFGNDEPGYFTDSLTEGTAIGFNIRAELKRWNGAGFDGSIDETMTMAKFFGTPGEISRTTSSGFVGGFDFATVTGGGFDEHLAQILNGSGGDPSDGIYLLELELTSPSFTTSDPFWVVFNLNQDEVDHDAAIDWVVSNLVPAPGAMAPLALAGPFMLRRRR
jgi:hypothetical protein